MSRLPLDRMEAWAWRMVMPALLWGGTATASVLTLATVFRVWQWRRDRPSQGWQMPVTGWLWWGYYGLQILGGLWSLNTEAWAFSLEVKAALFFLPLLAGIPGRSLSADFWWSVGWGVLAFLVWRVGVATGQWMLHGDVGGWRYAGFSGDVHPTYLSLHAVVAWLGVGRRWGNAQMVWPFSLLVAISLGLMGSKAGILAAVTVVAAVWLLGRKGSGFDPAAPAPSVRWAFLAVLFVSTWAVSSARFAELQTAAAAVQSEAAPIQSSSAGRVAVWSAAWTVMRTHPFGVGTGDVTDALMGIYEREGITYALDRKLNPHNQWLQAGVAFGWMGVVWLSVVFGMWCREAWRRRNALALLCCALVLCHALVESVLEVQRGVVFIVWLAMALFPHRRDSP